MIFKFCTAKKKAQVWLKHRPPSVEMRFSKIHIWLLLRKNDFSEWELVHFWFMRMLTSRAHMKSSGGLMVKNSNISKDQLHFLKRHIEAMLNIDSDDYEWSFHRYFRKVVFCDTSNVISMNLMIYNQLRNWPCSTYAYFLAAKFKIVSLQPSCKCRMATVGGG